MLDSQNQMGWGGGGGGGTKKKLLQTLSFLALPCSFTTNHPPPATPTTTSFTFVSSRLSAWNRSINHTSLATIRVVASCENLFQKVEREVLPFATKFVKCLVFTSSIMYEDRFHVCSLPKMAKKCTSLTTRQCIFTLMSIYW